MSKSMRRPLVAANWKMNGTRAANAAWITRFRAESPPCDVVVCAPFVYLADLVDGLQGTPFAAAAQDLSERAPGAFTGEVAAAMLVDLGVTWSIIGHSERRALHGDTDPVVAAKVERALQAGVRPIVCVGETLAQREAGETLAVVRRQIDAVIARCGAAAVARGVWAYEPVWAIGTGKTASPAQAQEVHAALRAHLAAADALAAAQSRILYGGSVKPSNAAELFGQPDIDGGLIGGAALLADDFAAICAAAG
jgi:triosephosphate isomerase